MVSTGEITIKTTNRYSLITIVKWAVYQHDADDTNQQNNQPCNQQLTNNQPAQRPSNNHKQEVKEIKNARMEENPLPPTAIEGDTTELVSICNNYTFSSELEQAVNDWITYKREKHQAYKPSGLNSLLTQVQKNANTYGDTAVIHAVHESMASNYQGIVWDKAKATAMPRNTGKTVTFVHPAIGKSYTVRGAKLGSDYTAASIDEQLQQNQQRSVLNARLFTETEQPTTRATASPIPHSPTIPSQPTSQAGNGERPTTRSISDISAELRNIDAAIGRIAKRVPLSDSADTGSNAERSIEDRGNIVSQPKRDEGSDRGERPEPPKPIVETPKPEPTVQSKPKRRSYDRGR